jgi:carboxypeptidase Q
MITFRMKSLAAAMLLGAGVCNVAFAQRDPATIDRIIDEGKNRNQVMKTLKDITNIGPRLTGSHNLIKGTEWAMKRFKSWGLQNVHLEQWGEVPVGFDRGKRCSAKVVSPEKWDMEFTSSSWTEGTRGPMKGAAIAAPATMEEFNAVKDKLKGAWVLSGTRRGRGGGGTSTPEDLIQAINDAGIAGRVYSSNNDLVITSGSWNGKTFESHPMDRSITVRKSDYDKLMALKGQNKDVVLEINLDQKFFKGPVPQYNIVADIPGTEKPDEVIIVSGHFDSWDGPGSQGALDNGTGSSTAMEAARILMAVKAKPKRTIRFVLWTGEEQGIFGSNGYVKTHEAELGKISAVLVDDGGTNYHGGYVGIASQQAMMEAAFAPTVKAFPELPMKFVVQERMPRGGGSDHVPFNAKGVPGFFTIETGKADYNFIHHTQHDKYEMAIPEYLVQSSTNHAVVSYNLACAETMLPRQPETPPTTGGGGGGRGE